MANLSDLEIIRELEESLWQSETRFNDEYMERVLAPDFFEFGRSGRIYTRAETIHSSYVKIRCKLPLKNFEIHPLGDLIVLVTYVSEVLYEEREFTNRSSIWSKTPSGWQIRFHQGTPVKDV